MLDKQVSMTARDLILPLVAGTLTFFFGWSAFQGGCAYLRRNQKMSGSGFDAAKINKRVDNLRSDFGAAVRMRNARFHYRPQERESARRRISALAFFRKSSCGQPLPDSQKRRAC